MAAFSRGSIDKLDPSEVLANLKQLRDENQGFGAAPTGDLEAILAGRIAEETKDYDGAAKSYFRALAEPNNARGRWGRVAFRSWVHATARTLSEPVDAQVLVRILLATSQDGQQSAHMRDQSLTTAAAVQKVVLEILKDSVALQPLPDEGSQDAVLTRIRPENLVRGKWPEGDPLLKETSAVRCKSPLTDEAAWRLWAMSLPKPHLSYWEGRVFQCRDRGEEAVEAYRRAYRAMEGIPTLSNARLEAAAQIVQILRSRGLREAAAAAYIDLVAAWQSPFLSAAAHGMSVGEFSVKRVDDTLWAARQLALTGDFERAKGYAQEAIELVDGLQSRDPRLWASHKEKLIALEAEAFHVLAFRVALERGEWQSAVALNDRALSLPDLSTDWRERLQWYAGLYEYSSGQTEPARTRWEALLAATKDDAVRARLYFWLARIYLATGRQSEAQVYIDALIKEFPLSFYSVIALPESASGASGREATPLWFLALESPGLEGLADTLRRRPREFLKTLEARPEAARITGRAELLVAARSGDFARMAVQDFEDLVRKSPSERDRKVGLLYASRLYGAAGFHHGAIRLTTELSGAEEGFWRRYPEQLLAVYGRPYSSLFREAAQREGIDRSLLLSIARQESSFDPSVKSPAGAIGLMQLMPHTAKRFDRKSKGDASDSGMKEASAPLALTDPAVSTRIGAAYLRHLVAYYQGALPQVIGAYNAGEFAVDQWVRRRPAADPLLWIELVPFGETQGYIRNVWRNIGVYRWLETLGTQEQDAPLAATSMPSSERGPEEGTRPGL